ncbi:MAG: DUF1015 domain-containing protein [Spirochaetota bacterium]
MAVIRPFAALRPRPDMAGRVASVPYDVVDTEEARELARGKPESFLHVVRPEIDLPGDVDPYDERVYRAGRDNLQRLISEGVLEEDGSPCLYLYALSEGEHRQVGVAACCAVEDYERGVIKKHEHTRREKEVDRVRHMLALRAHTGPVLMAHRGGERIHRLVQRHTIQAPLYDFTATDGVRHTLWRVPGEGALVEAFAGLPALYIADGHHRAAGACRVKQELESGRGGTAAGRGAAGEGAPSGGLPGGSASLEGVPGDEEYRYFLAVLFPAEQMRILPYNRYVSDLGGMGPGALLDEVKRRFHLAEGGPEPTVKGRFGMYLAGRWYLLEPREHPHADPTDPVASLDLTVFQRLFLEPLLGIRDQKSDPRIDFVGGSDSAGRLAARVDREGGAAFTFFPVAVEELLAVADAGKIMPPKSTWFSPKLRSGLLVHRF